jgi:hypothetical protein
VSESRVPDVWDFMRKLRTAGRLWVGFPTDPPGDGRVRMAGCNRLCARHADLSDHAPPCVVDTAPFAVAILNSLTFPGSPLAGILIGIRDTGDFFGVGPCTSVCGRTSRQNRVLGKCCCDERFRA